MAAGSPAAVGTTRRSLASIRNQCRLGGSFTPGGGSKTPSKWLKNAVQPSLQNLQTSPFIFSLSFQTDDQHSPRPDWRAVAARFAVSGLLSRRIWRHRRSAIRSIPLDFGLSSPKCKGMRQAWSDWLGILYRTRCCDTPSRIPLDPKVQNPTEYASRF